MVESGQLDLVELLREQTEQANEHLTNVVDALNPQIDANPNDKLLMEMLDIVTDAQESVGDLQGLLQTMQQRDQSELP